MKKELRMTEIDRMKKAEKIAKLLGKNINSELSDLTALDVGCYDGLLTMHLKPFFGTIVGIDPDRVAIRRFMERIERDKLNIKVYMASGLEMPFSNGIFDVVICNHVYEHVPDADKLIYEIYRVLKKGGYLYMAAGNFVCPMELHYQLPFLQYLPLSYGKTYIRLSGKKFIHYDYKNLRTYGQILHLLSPFKIEDETFEVIRHPDNYGMSGIITTIGSKICPMLKGLCRPFVPTYLFVCKKL